MTGWTLLRSFGLRRSQVTLAVIAVAILGVAAPGSSQAHHPSNGPVADHLEEDFVVHSPAKERRLERRTARITAPDVAVAQRRAPDDPGQVGQWGPVVDWPVVGVHVALLTNGKVVAYDSVGDRATETYPVHNFTRATVWDPQTGIQTTATVTTGFNIFCSGLAHLMDGTLFAAGGNKDSSLNGIRQTHLFDQSSNTWNRGADMAEERWYPTVTPLRDGEMLITEGGPNVPEVRQNNGTIRRLTSASLNQPLYPWMDVAPDGRAFYSGPDNRMASLNPSGTGAWQMQGTRDGADRDYGSHAMYDIGKILVAGGGNSLSSARTINLNGASPQVSNTASMASGRRQHNLTVLADGSVLATGGNSSGAGLVDMNNGVYTAELWNPATGTWRTLASEQVTRQYHSTALLLPDGRVLSSGGGICGACDSQGYLAKNAQVFSPPYLFKKDGSGDLAPRPTITSAPGAVSYNSAFTINTPAPSSIGKVAMVRLGAVTHSVNMEQRYVPLSFTAGGGNLTATAPLNANIAPPGYYMLFVIGTDGVPSVASMVRVENDTTAPGTPSLTDTDPDSPANDNSPEVKGSAEAGSTVKIYSSADCTGTPLASGTAAAFTGSGITTPVAGDQTTNLRATATDAAGNASGCSAALAYTEDSSAPATPSLTDTDPDSPANDNNPEVKGSAEAGSTVRIYSTAGCTGSPLATGTAAELSGAGITAPVPGDQTTSLRATATDLAGNTSGCSAALAYTEVSAPAVPSLTDTDPDSPANDNNPEVKGSAEAGSTVKIYSSADCTGTPLASGSAAAFNGAGITTAVPGDQTTNLRATATATAGTGSTSGCSAALAYTEDSTAPQTQIDSGPQGPTSDQTPSFGFSATGGAQSFECRFDSAAFGPCSGPGETHTASAQLADGAHTFEVRAADQAGNTDQTPASRAFTVDTTAPQTQIDSGPQGPTSNNDPSFSFSSSESNSSFECRLDGPGAATGTFASCTSPKVFSGLADGAYTFQVRATDSTGSTDQSPASRAFTVDTSAPQTQIDSGPQGPTSNNDPSFSFSSSESNSSFECRLDGPGAATGTFASCTSPKVFSGLADGAYTFQVRATDSTGSTDQSPASRAFTVDTSAPQTQIDSGPQGPTADSTPSFGFSATGGAQSFECRFDSAAFGPCSGPGDTHTASAQLADGAHTFEVRAADQAGNTDQTPASRAFTVDTTAPQTQIDSGPQGPTSDQTPSFGFSATGGAQSFECRFDSAAFGPCSGPGETHTASAQLADGAHTFEVRAADQAGNTDQTPASRSFTVDTAAPQAPSLTDTDPDSPANDNNPEVKGSAEAGSAVRIYSTAGCTGSPLATGTAAELSGAGITTPVPGDQTTNLRATATDAVGNASGCSSALAYTEDSNAPASPSITDTDPDSPANDNNPEVKGSAEAGSTVKIYSTAGCTGSPLATGTAAELSGAGITTPVPGDQTTNLRATATDAVGNTSGCSSALAYTEDSNAPASPSITDTDPDSPANDNNPEVKGSAEAGSTVRIYSTAGCTGSPLATGTAAELSGAGITTPVPGDQTTNLRATATDAVGNASGCSSALVYREDSTAPQTQIDSGPQGPTSNNDPSFSFSSSESNSSFECRLDGPGAATGTFASCTSPKVFSGLADGAYTLQVRASDQAQNTDQTPASRAFTVDTTAPQTQIDSGPQGPTSDQTPSFGFSATGGAQSFECRFDSAAFGPCSGPGETHTASPQLADGAHTFEVRAADQAQNTDQTPASRSFTVDTTAPAAPSLTDTDPESPANDNNPEVKGSAEAGSRVEIFASADCSGTPLASGTAGELDSPGLTVNVEDDETTSLRARASDRAGNESGCSAVIEYTEDSTPPDTQLIDAPPSETSKRKVKFAFSSTEAQSTFLCRLDKAKKKPCESPLTKRVTRDRHVFRVYALDPSGNADSAPAKVKFRVLAKR